MAHLSLYVTEACTPQTTTTCTPSARPMFHLPPPKDPPTHLPTPPSPHPPHTPAADFQKWKVYRCAPPSLLSAPSHPKSTCLHLEVSHTEILAHVERNAAPLTPHQPPPENRPNTPKSPRSTKSARFICRDSLHQSPDESSRNAMDVCKVSDTSKVSISRPGPQTPRASSRSERARGVFKILSPRPTFEFCPQTARRASTHHACNMCPRQAQGIVTICLQNRFRPAGRTDSLSTPGTVSHVSRRHQIVSRPFLASQNRN